MTYIVEQDIANINKQIASLQAYVKNQGHTKAGAQKQVDEHNHNVVILLQNKLADTSVAFKDVLEIRTKVRAPARPSACLLIDRRPEHEGVQGPHGAVHVLHRRLREPGPSRYRRWRHACVC